MGGTVLIAEGKRARARRLGEACAARGFDTAFANHGAAALETALSEVPEVVVAPLELALIDGRKLADILRANPRTQAVRFILLGEVRDRVAEGDYFDEVMPADSEPEEVAARVEVLIAQRARLDAAWGEAEADHEVEGRLSQIPLPDLLQLFHMNRRTGRIELSRRGAGGREERGTIWLREGNLLQAAEGSVEGEKALFRLLTWDDGSFAFAPNRANVAPRILTPTRALLMEGMRQLDEWDRLRGKLPALDAQVSLRVKSGDLPNVVHPLTQEVLLLLEIYGDVRSVVDHCSHPDYQVLRTLHTLVERGIVELRHERLKAAPVPVEGLFSPAQINRLRDWLGVGRPRGCPLREAKLLVVSPDPDATRDLVRVLSQLPGAQLEPPFREGSFAADDLLPLGRVPVDAELWIQLVHVPAGRSFAPVWPAAAHGALGVLLVLCGSLREAEEAVRPVTEVLLGMPRSRIFHLLLLRKGERVAPDELRGELSILDQASLFLLPLEGGTDPASLLRTMLGRILP